MKRVLTVTVLGLALPHIRPRAGGQGSTLKLLPNERPEAAAAGSDGNMWFTTNQGRIARVTPGGHVTEFGHGLNNGGASLFGSIVAGGDGALWTYRVWI